MISEEFKKNVESGDAVTVRSALVDSLIIDTTFRQFDEALAYAEKYMSVVENDDGQQDYILDDSLWNESYLNKQKVALMVNFSEKRIKHIKNVVQAVLTSSKKIKESSKENNKSESKQSSGRTGRTIISETPIARQENAPHKTSVRKTNNQSAVNIRREQSHNSRESTGSRTGRRTIDEKTSEVNRSEEEVHPLDIAAWMIGGGITVAAVGGITAGVGAAIAKPAMVQAGLVVAGTGGVIAMSGGIIKIVRER